jgi:hypothetical protein
MKWIGSKLEKRLHDPEAAVVTAALITSVDVLNVCVPLIFSAGFF